MKNLTDFRKTVETGVDPRLRRLGPSVFTVNSSKLFQIINNNLIRLMFTPTLMTLNYTLPFHWVALVRHRLLEPWRDASNK